IGGAASTVRFGPAAARGAAGVFRRVLEEGRLALVFPHADRLEVPRLVDLLRSLRHPLVALDRAGGADSEQKRDGGKASGEAEQRGPLESHSSSFEVGRTSVSRTPREISGGSDDQA